MAFKDYQPAPSANTTIGDDVFIGPNMARNKVRPALQQLAADGRGLYDYVQTLMSTVSGGVTVGDLTLRADLAPDSGSTLVGFKGFGTGSVPRNVRDKLRDVVSAKDFGVVGDGTTNDTAALQAAIDSLGATGGSIEIPGTLKIRLTSNLTVKPNVSLNFAQGWTGRSSVGPGTDTDYESMGGIRLASTATIILQGGASINGALIYRDGATFPEANSSSFAGTAITAAGDDIAVSRCFIMGFNKAVYVNGYVRPRVEYVYFDCNNGIELANCGDVAYLDACHGWPWATIAALGVDDTIERSGIGFYLHDITDWARVTDCFAYGYMTGFKVTNANSVTLLSCGADDTYDVAPLHAGSVGFEVSGSSGDTRLIGVQSAGHGSSGIRINTDSGVSTLLVGCTVWQNGTHGVLIDSGDAHITSGTLIRDVTNGVTVNNATSNVYVQQSTRFERVTNPLNAAVSTSKFVSPGGDFATLAAGTPAAGSNMIVPSLASAATLALPANGDVFIITGTTNITSITGMWARRKVTLLFSGILTVTNNAASATVPRLTGNTNFTTAAGSQLTLEHTGTQLYGRTGA